jgi:hypothetical protein
MAEPEISLVRCLALGALCASAAFAQPYEIGGAVGYGFYRNGTIYSPGVHTQAGIRDRFASGFVFGEDLYGHISGEVRYLYHDGHPFLSGASMKGEIQGQSHAFHYDLLFQTTSRESRLRPFFAVGAGAKGYIVAGPAPSPQPLPGVAALTTKDEWKLLVVAGAGVKYRVHKNVLLRFDLLDYMTGFPRRQIAPSGSNTARGIFQQITPMLGVSYLF